MRLKPVRALTRVIWIAPDTFQSVAMRLKPVRALTHQHCSILQSRCQCVAMRLKPVRALTRIWCYLCKWDINGSNEVEAREGIDTDLHRDLLI